MGYGGGRVSWVEDWAESIRAGWAKRAGEATCSLCGTVGGTSLVQGVYLDGLHCRCSLWICAGCGIDFLAKFREHAAKVHGVEPPESPAQQLT